VSAILAWNEPNLLANCLFLVERIIVSTVPFASQIACKVASTLASVNAQAVEVTRLELPQTIID